MRDHLSARERRFAERLLDASSDALFTLTLDGRVLSWNRGAESMFGYTSHEAVGRPIGELTIADEHRREAAVDLRRALEQGVVTGHRLRRRKDGSLLPVRVAMYRHEDADGEPFAAVCERDDTTAGRLHDLEVSESKFRSLLETAPDAIVIVDRDGHITIVNAQTEKLFGYSRDELLGKPVELLIPERLRQAHPAHRASFFAEPRVRGMGSGLELAGRRKDGSDLSNAIKFTPDGGRIIVRVTSEGPALFRIDVEDSGFGIPPEQLGKLFAPFQQLDGSAAKRYQGTGLGLALTKRIAEAHGGRVAVRSTPSQGSTFSAILPRAIPRRSDTVRMPAD